MKPQELKEAIRVLMERQKASTWTLVQICDALHLKGKDRKRLLKWMNELVLEGAVVRIRGNQFSLGRAADLVTGTLEVDRRGTGYLCDRDGGLEVVIAADDLGTALPGDRVVVRLCLAPSRVPVRAGDDRKSAKVIRILERGRRDVVGTLKSTGRFLYVVPVDPSYRHDFYVPEPAGAREGDRVVIRFAGWANRHVNPEAEIVEVIGPADQPSFDTVSVLKHYGLKEEFPTAVLREAERVSQLMNRPGARLDLRGRRVITIDPERARDFDDALSLETDEAGHRVLGVHIADVAHFVRRNGPLDREARERGNSVYFPDQVIPMLPEQLSNGVCSLKPGEDRLAFSVFLTIQADGKVLHRSFARSIIRSSARLTYEEALAILERRSSSGGSGQPLAAGVEGLVGDLHALAQQLRAGRFARHALDLDLPECEIVIGPDARMTGIRIVPNDISHQLVEECMVAANEAVASELAGNGVRVLARLHEPPRPVRIEELRLQLGAMGYKPGDLRQPRHLAGFLRSIRKDPLAYPVQVAVLRSMKRAVYSAKDSGHFGLAKRYYSHFTSPIRRYPDLVLHRQLAHRLEGEPGSLYEPDELVRIAEHCSATEQAADEAERTLVDLKKFRLLQEELESGHPRLYDAVVVSVTNFGMFVEVLDLQLQGLVHISGISDSFVRFERQSSSLRARDGVFRIGARVQVRVASVDFEKRRIDFALARS